MALDQSLLYNVAQVGRELSAGFDAQLKGMGLTAARAKVLLLLSRNPDGINQAGVTEFLQVEHPTAVRILDGLESLGHIRRLPDPNDRRAKVIVLTDAGKPLADEVVVLTKRINAALLDGLHPADIAKANAFLMALLSNLTALKRNGLPEAGESEQ
jgi:MarR family transcriptional regulator for hemolysin